MKEAKLTFDLMSPIGLGPRGPQGPQGIQGPMTQFADPIEWSSSKTYDPLTIVTYQGNSYTSRKRVPKGIDINDAQYWVETGNYNAQVEQYRQETLSIKQILDAYADNILIPDKMNGNNDTEKIQMAFDSLKDTGGVILLDRMYTITSPVYINIESDAEVNGHKRRIYVIGYGVNSGFNFTYAGTVTYKQNATSGYYGGIFFSNVKFYGTGTQICFDTARLIRLFFSQCYFDSFSRVFNSESFGDYINRVMQDIHCMQCYFTHINEYVLYASTGIWACNFIQCTCENSRTFIQTGGASTEQAIGATLITVDTCVIEGLTGSAIVINGPTNPFIIKNTYFEGNAVYDIEQNYGGKTTVQITGCYFDGYESHPCIKVPKDTSTYPVITVNDCCLHNGILIGALNPISLCFVSYERVQPGNGIITDINSNYFVNVAPSAVHKIELIKNNINVEDTGQQNIDNISITIPAYSFYTFTVTIERGTISANRYNIGRNSGSLIINSIAIDYSPENSWIRSITVSGITTDAQTLYLNGDITVTGTLNVKIQGFYFQQSFKG